MKLSINHQYKEKKLKKPKYHKLSKRLNEEHTEEPENKQSYLINNEPDSRVIGLYGVIEEERCSSLIGGLYHLKNTGFYELPIDPKKPEKGMELHQEPIDFILKTEGGSVNDMFAVYDVMRLIQEDCPILTFGIGQVMSAGVLLLAAGNKGGRRAGSNTRLMLHSIVSGQYGHIHDHENQIKEALWYQDRYVSTLTHLTNGKLSEKKLKSIFKDKLDYHFDAYEAKRLGIIDYVV